jgi:hypothetical protein
MSLDSTPEPPSLLEHIHYHRELQHPLHNRDQAPINLPAWNKIAAWKKKAIRISDIERKIPLKA